MDSQLLWYTARAAGLLTWALVAGSVVWGLALSSRNFGARKGPRPNWMLDLHRFLGGAAVVFTGIHIVTIMLDTYVHFGLVEVLVPLASSWKPVAVAWGIVAFYLLLAVEITSLLRRKLSKRVWKLTHLMSYPLFVLGTVHLLTAGTDAVNIAVRTIVASVVALVAVLTVARVRSARAATAPTAPIPRTPAPHAAPASPAMPMPPTTLPISTVPIIPTAPAGPMTTPPAPAAFDVEAEPVDLTEVLT